MINTFQEVYNYSIKQKISLRMASYIIAIKHIEKVYKSKGISII